RSGQPLGKREKARYNPGIRSCPGGHRRPSGRIRRPGGPVLRRALFIAAVLTLASALAPVFAQEISEEIFTPAGFDPFDPEILVGGVNDSVPCTDAGLALQPLPDGAEGFAIPGEFLLVKNEDLCRSFNVPLRLGVPYKAIYVEFDLDLDQWVTPIF